MAACLAGLGALAIVGANVARSATPALTGDAGKAAVACQKAIDKASATFMGTSLKALAGCGGSLLKCVEVKSTRTDERAQCTAKAAAKCDGQLATIAAARAKLQQVIATKCAQVPIDVLRSDAGLGFASADAECGTGIASAAALAVCLAQRVSCATQELFEIQQPRGRELMRVFGVSGASGLGCLSDLGGTGDGFGDREPNGAGVAKCQRGIHGSAASFVRARLKGLHKCAEAVLACRQKSGSDDARLMACLVKANANCRKALAAQTTSGAGSALDRKLRGTIAAKCASDKVAFTDLVDPAGANLAGLSDDSAVSRATLIAGCTAMTSLGTYLDCLNDRQGQGVEGLLATQFPQAQRLFGQVGCNPSGGGCGGLPSKGSPVPTPHPTVHVDGAELIAAGLLHTRDVAVDGAGNAYVIGMISDNAFKITPAGVVTELIDGSGDGAGHFLDQPYGIAVDVHGNVYVSAQLSRNVFKIVPDGTVTQILDATGAGPFHEYHGGSEMVLDRAGNLYVNNAVYADEILKVAPGGAVSSFATPASQVLGMAIDAADNLYVTGSTSDDAFKISPTGTVTKLIDATGDGAGHALDRPTQIVVDDDGTVYLVGTLSHNAFKITPDGTIAQIIDSSGDGAGRPLTFASDIALDAAGDVYVTGQNSRNAFRINPSGTVTEVIDATRDGASDPLRLPRAVAATAAGRIFVAGGASNDVLAFAAGGSVETAIDLTGTGDAFALGAPGSIVFDASANAYVGASYTRNVLKIGGSSGLVTQIFDPTGDGAGNVPNSLTGLAIDADGNIYAAGGFVFKITPQGSVTRLPIGSAHGLHGNTSAIAVDPSGNVFVATGLSDAFKITPAGSVTKIIDVHGDGLGHTFGGSHSLAVDGEGNAYVGGSLSDNVFKVSPAGTKTLIVSAAGDGAGHALDAPYGLALDHVGNLFVAGYSSRNVLKVTPSGVVIQIIGPEGDGAGHVLAGARGIAVDADGNVYVTGSFSDNAFRVRPNGEVTALIDRNGDGNGNVLDNPVAIALDPLGRIHIVGDDSNNIFRLAP